MHSDWLIESTWGVKLEYKPVLIPSVKSVLWRYPLSKDTLQEWIQNGEFHNGEITKRRIQNGEHTKWRRLQNGEITKRRTLQNGESYKTANVTKRRTLQNGENYKTL